jgi:hypothetical protein
LRKLTISIIGIFLKFCEYNHTLEGSSHWPTSHEGELFLGIVALKYLYVTWFYDLFFTDDVGVFFLIVVDDDFVTKLEFIKEGKNLIIRTLFPRIV